MNSWLSEQRLEKWMQVLWGLVLLTIPVTSFRWLPNVLGTTQVRPLAFYPLALLVPVMFVYLLRTRKFRLPAPTSPLLAFILVAAISTVLGGLYNPSDLKGFSYWEWALRSWLSLAIGMGFFWVSVLASRSEESLRKSLPWMYAGLVLSILWGGLQALAQYTPLLDYDFVNDIQLSFSIRRIMNRRVSAFAFEPSWLADQIVLFYFPWLFAALLTRFRLTKYQWLEPVLCLGSVVLLLLTYSRSGIIELVVAVMVVMLTVGRGLLVSVWSWFWAPFTSPEIRGVWLRIIILLVLLLSLAGAFYWLNSYDYFASLWNADLSEGLAEYATDISAGARLAYIQAGLEIFNLHPWFGVGLGGSSFYLYNHLPNWSLIQPHEIAEQTSPGSKVIPNVRNLIVRLLSETGVIGLWLHIAFMLSILGSIRKMFLSRRNLMVYASVAGLTVWPAIILRQFTLSTLTSPVMWISLGMAVGYAHHVLDVPDAAEFKEVYE
jgi:hypothetical protein